MSFVNLGNDELEKLESGIGIWYCSNCKADCGLCSGAVLGCHKAVQCSDAVLGCHTANQCDKCDT